MATITQVQCDIDDCTQSAAFTGVETTVKVGQNLAVKKMDLCTKHKQELINLTPIVGSTDNKFTFSHANATR